MEYLWSKIEYYCAKNKTPCACGGGVVIKINEKCLKFTKVTYSVTKESIFGKYINKT